MSVGQRRIGVGTRAKQRRDDRIVCAELFDAEYYARENPDLTFGHFSPIDHFCSIGWVEGRDPHSDFDSRGYLEEHADVAAARINPLAHYLSEGRLENRHCVSANPLSNRVKNWHSAARDLIYAAISAVLDREEYAAAAGISWIKNHNRINLAHHWLTRGFKTVDPVRTGITAEATKQAIDRFKKVIDFIPPNDPLFGVIDAVIASLAAGLPDSADGSAGERALEHLTDHERFVVDVIAREFDHGFYVETNPDLDFSRVDPLVHFTFLGWKEGRNPVAAFDCSFYLSTNLDVKAAELNPFYHFLVAGRDEGRIWRRRGGVRRTIVESLLPPERRPAQPDRSLGSTLAPAVAIGSVLEREILAGKKFALSISHDCYVQHIGGTQIFLSDEQAKLNAEEFCYVHIAPIEPRLHLLRNTKDYRIHLTVDGKYLYQTSITRLIEALRKVGGRAESVGIVHSLLGHDLDLITSAFNSLQVGQSFFWLHDYSSICSGFNLLRNDVEFCGAPPVASLACRVCIYGETRRDHLEKVESFFATTKPVIVSPSMAALEIWTEKTSYIPEIRVVAPHVELIWDSPIAERFRFLCGTGADPVVVGFVGYPAIHKGWDTFRRLLETLGDDPRFKFIHFGRQNTYIDHLEFVALEVTADDREAAIRLLMECNVDVVINAAIWPETFSFVTFEAAASGSFVFTISDAGNVARAVEEQGFGMVFQSETDLIEAFTSGAAITFIRENAQLRERVGRFSLVGTTQAVLAEIS